MIYSEPQVTSPTGLGSFNGCSTLSSSSTEASNLAILTQASFPRGQWPAAEAISVEVVEQGSSVSCDWLSGNGRAAGARWENKCSVRCVMCKIQRGEC